MANRYKEFKQLNLPSIEKEILKKWERENAFEKSVELREGAEPFVFYEGPPSANEIVERILSGTPFGCSLSSFAAFTCYNNCHRVR